MRPDDLLELVRKRPFVPFKIHLTDGKSYEVSHPDQIIILRSRAVVGAGHDNGLPDHLEHLALVHVVRLEELPSEPEGEQG